MNAKPNPWAARWHRIATLRRTLVLLADGCIGAVAGGAAANTASLGDAMAIGIGAACAFDVAWRWCRVAGVSWRRRHRHGWARELPDAAGSAFTLAACAYCIVVGAGQVPSWTTAAMGAAWGALLALIVAGHARRVRRRAERLALRAQ